MATTFHEGMEVDDKKSRVEGSAARDASVVSIVLSGMSISGDDGGGNICLKQQQQGGKDHDVVGYWCGSNFLKEMCVRGCPNATTCISIGKGMDRVRKFSIIVSITEILWGMLRLFIAIFKVLALAVFATTLLAFFINFNIHTLIKAYALNLRES